MITWKAQCVGSAHSIVIVCSTRTTAECDSSCGMENCRRHVALAAAVSPPGPAKLMNSGPGVAKRKGCPASKRRAAAAPASCHVGSSSPTVPPCSPSRILTPCCEPAITLFLTTCSRAPNRGCLSSCYGRPCCRCCYTCLGSDCDAAFLCTIQLNRLSARKVNIVTHAKSFPSAHPQESLHQVGKQREQRFRPALLDGNQPQ